MTKSQAEKIKQIPRLLRAIKLRCLDCSAYNFYEVKMCVQPNCPLFPYREGKINDDSLKIIREKGQLKAKKGHSDTGLTPKINIPKFSESKIQLNSGKKENEDN